MELFERLEWWLEGLMLFVTAVLGLLGNLVFIVVFTCNRRNLNTFHRFGIDLSSQSRSIRRREKPFLVLKGYGTFYGDSVNIPTNN